MGHRLSPARPPLEPGTSSSIQAREIADIVDPRAAGGIEAKRSANKFRVVVSCMWGVALQLLFSGC